MDISELDIYEQVTGDKKVDDEKESKETIRLVCDDPGFEKFCVTFQPSIIDGQIVHLSTDDIDTLNQYIKKWVKKP